MKGLPLFSALVIFSLASHSAHAALEMKVFEGYASSKAVLAERYESAIAIAEKREKTGNRFYRIVNATSLCVALVKTDRVEEAAQACARATAELDGIAPKYKGMDREFISDAVMTNQAVVSALMPTIAHK